MTEENKKLKVVFAPGCFDDFEGTQEELDELVAEIKSMVENGEFFEKAIPVDIGTLDDDYLEELDNIFDDDIESLPTRKTLN